MPNLPRKRKQLVSAAEKDDETQYEVSLEIDAAIAIPMYNQEQNTRQLVASQSAGRVSNCCDITSYDWIRACSLLFRPYNMNYNSYVQRIA